MLSCFPHLPHQGHDFGLRRDFPGARVRERPGLRGLVSGSEPGGPQGNGLQSPRGAGRSGCSALL